ncbi:dual specificity protein phosphatase 26 isoform X1 [Kogia breviceps]|uniref:dual specificity protein phosphatase 26 isoform X1 n=2 Tax=Kogia breviceps TaxID=27615 RepID=UPI0034D29E55
MCPGNWLWASVTFMARFSRGGSRSPVHARGALEEIPAVQHPFLNVFELERLLYTGKTACNHADEVWPGLYLGDQEIASNHRELCRLGISHVLNASHSRWRGTPEAYVGLGIRYLGVEAHDSPAFDMSVHFQAAADFIHRALSQPGGRILVHCAVGVSRSATLVLAYLMLYHSLTLVEAIKKVKDHRGIIPNRGFLRQLLALDRRLRQRLQANQERGKHEQDGVELCGGGGSGTDGEERVRKAEGETHRLVTPKPGRRGVGGLARRPWVLVVAQNCRGA